MTPEELRQKARELRQQANIAEANCHRLTGAAIAYEEMAKSLEDGARAALPQPSEPVPEKAGE